MTAPPGGANFAAATTYTFGRRSTCQAIIDKKTKKSTFFSVLILRARAEKNCRKSLAAQIIPVTRDVQRKSRPTIPPLQTQHVLRFLIIPSCPRCSTGPCGSAQTPAAYIVIATAQRHRTNYPAGPAKTARPAGQAFAPKSRRSQPWTKRRTMLRTSGPSPVRTCPADTNCSTQTGCSRNRQNCFLRFPPLDWLRSRTDSYIPPTNRPTAEKSS